MLAHGVPVLGDPGDLPLRCARILADGPPPLTGHERDRLRYGLTDLLDDHTHATDPAGSRLDNACKAAGFTPRPDGRAVP
jgi:hypothetical protein